MRVSGHPFSIESPTFEGALEAVEGAIEEGPVEEMADEKLGRLVDIALRGDVGEAGISGRGNRELRLNEAVEVGLRGPPEMRLGA